MTSVKSQNKLIWIKVTKMYDTLNYASMQMQHLRKAEIFNKDSIVYYQSLHDRMERESAPFIAARNKTLKATFRKYPSFFTAYYALNSGALTEASLKEVYAGFGEKLKEAPLGKTGMINCLWSAS